MNRISCKLSDLVEVKNGSTPSTTRSDFYNGNIVWITPKDLSNIKSKFIYSSERKITKAGFDSCSTSLLPIGSVLLSSRAPIGLLAICAVETCTNQGFKNLVVKKDKLHNEYLYYWLKTKVKYIDSLGTGTTFKEVSKGVIENLVIELPKDLKDQQKIASVLSALDSKIELNNRINAELESMAKTLYDYWFVQFDFPDKNGMPYKTSGGKMIWNEELKREIPEGWEVLDLEKVENNIITGKTPSTTNPNFYNGHIPFITIGDVRGNMHIVSTIQKLTIDGANQQANKFIPKGAICVTCIASPGLVGFATEDSQTNQQLNSVVCKNYENKYFLYFYLTDYFKYSSAKTGNTFANMNKGDFSSIKVIKPHKDIVINFSNVLDSTIEKILNNSLENQKLTELRDWLLPMLMNGQVKAF